MSSLSSNAHLVLCNCGGFTTIKTSWTQQNPGRRFFCCDGRCGFVRWVDPPVPDRASLLITGLVNSLKREREHAAQQERTIRKLKWSLIGSWGFIVWSWI
ncbi:hypothetical protein R6Q57_030170 [Mikania cordata]